MLTSLTENLLDYPILAVGQSLLPNIKKLLRGFTLEIDSSIPVGSGCGSSSAIAVTIAGVIQLFLEERIDREKVFDTALEIEEFKHGTPSGGDPAAVFYGGFIWFEKNEGGRQITPLESELAPEIAEKFILVDTGKPAESTGEMIATVKEHLETDKAGIEAVFHDQARLVDLLAEAIKNTNEEIIMKCIQEGERNLEALGVVSEYVKSIIRDFERTGSVAKISGGGGKTKGTGMLLVYTQNIEKIKEVCKKYDLDFLTTSLGVEGLRLEN